LLVKAAIQAG